MPRRPCLGVPPGSCPQGSLAEPRKPRCATCEQQHQRQRNATRPQYRGTWPAESKQRIAEYRVTHGDICPGWSGDPTPHPIHPSEWTCDHDEGPMCRSHNGAKGGSHDRARAAARRNAR